MSLKSNIFSLGPQEISEFRSGVYFQQENGSFTFAPFPSTAQLSPVLSMNWDEASKSIWLGGNFSGFRVDWEKVLLRHSLPGNGRMRASEKFLSRPQFLPNQRFEITDPFRFHGFREKLAHCHHQQWKGLLGFNPIKT